MSETLMTEGVAEAWALLRDFFTSAQETEAASAMVQRLNDALVEEVGELGELREDLDASTRALLVAFFAAAASDPEEDIEISEAVLDLARTLAIRTPDVGVLLRAYRVGQRLAWREFTTILDREVADPELRLAALSFLFERLSLELERVVDASVAVFTAERDQWLGGALARRAEVVAALLAGADLDPDEATRILGHRLHPGQLAVLVWLEETLDGGAALQRLEGVVRAVAQTLGAPVPLTLPEGAKALSAWLNLTQDPDLALIAGLLARSAPGVQIALGAVAPGPSGFRSSHRQAVLAKRVARASYRSAPVTDYRSVAVLSPFLDDQDSLADLVRTELAGLAGHDADAVRLRETALAYLRASGNARDAAQALGVHKNTVLYRLRSIEEALGHPLLERRLPLEIALHLVEVLGPQALP